MAFRRRLSFLSFLQPPLAVLLALALLGVAVQECGAVMPGCKADCCPTATACLTLDFSQAPAAAPDAPPLAPATKLVLLAVFAFALTAAPLRRPASISVSPAFRSDPGGRRAPTRAFLRCWTL